MTSELQIYYIVLLKPLFMTQEDFININAALYALKIRQNALIAVLNLSEDQRAKFNQEIDQDSQNFLSAFSETSPSLHQVLIDLIDGMKI